MPVRAPPRQSHAKIVLEAGAEIIGTALLCAFGTGANCQYAVAGLSGDSYTSVPIGFAVGIAFGAAFAGRWSDGHINPAVTLMLALTNNFPWWKVPIYWLSQVTGGFLGAAIAYGVYFHDISVIEGGLRTVAKTGGLFGTYPAMDTPAFSCWLTEFFGATILISAVLYMVTKTRRSPLPFYAIPVVLFLVLLGVASSFGATTSFALNPARDLGPRLLTYAAGYGREVWTYRSQYWLWGGQMGAFSAAIFVAGVNRLYNYIIKKVPQAALDGNAPVTPEDVV